jgi:nucleoside-diphosphate-sugar epimerase
MRVLVAGASGTVGGAVVRALLRRGHEVRALVTDASGAAAAKCDGAEIVVGDLLDPDTAPRLVPTVEGVVQAAQIRLPYGPSSIDKEAAVRAADRRMTEALAQACLAAPSRPALIYTSGTWAYGEHGEQWVDEETPAVPTAASRGHEEMAERVLQLHRERGLSATVVLPGVIYGAVPSFEDWFYRPLVGGQLRMVGDGANYWSFIHADDLGDAYAQALEQPKPGERFNVVDDEPLRVREFLALVAACASCPAPEAISPSDARLTLGDPLTESLMLSTRVRNHKAKRLLAWRPRFRSVTDGIPAAIAQIASGAGLCTTP